MSSTPGKEWPGEWPHTDRPVSDLAAEMRAYIDGWPSLADPDRIALKRWAARADELMEGGRTLVAEIDRLRAELERVKAAGR